MIGACRKGDPKALGSILDEVTKEKGYSDHILNLKYRVSALCMCDRRFLA